MPSNWKLVISKPRADSWLRPRSTGLTEMPMVPPSASATVIMAWSSMRWRVTMETDCGVSRTDRFRPVAVPMAPLV
ncbi:hypothetical protein D3C87_2158030 [compost metagenome]